MLWAPTLPDVQKIGGGGGGDGGGGYTMPPDVKARFDKMQGFTDMIGRAGGGTPGPPAPPLSFNSLGAEISRIAQPPLPAPAPGGPQPGQANPFMSYNPYQEFFKNYFGGGFGGGGYYG